MRFIGFIGVIPCVIGYVVFCLIRGGIAHRKEIIAKRNLENGQI